MAAGQVRVDDFGSTKTPRLRRWERVVSALCADAFEPPAFVARHSFGATAAGSTLQSAFRIPHGKRADLSRRNLMKADGSRPARRDGRGRSGDSVERRHFEFGQRRSADAPLRSKKFSARGVLADGHRPRPTKIRVYAFQIMSATVRFAGTNGSTCSV